MLRRHAQGEQAEGVGAGLHAASERDPDDGAERRFRKGTEAILRERQRRRENGHVAGEGALDERETLCIARQIEAEHAGAARARFDHEDRRGERRAGERKHFQARVARGVVENTAILELCDARVEFGAVDDLGHGHGAPGHGFQIGRNAVVVGGEREGIVVAEFLDPGGESADLIEQAQQIGLECTADRRDGLAAARSLGLRGCGLEQAGDQERERDAGDRDEGDGQTSGAGAVFGRHGAHVSACRRATCAIRPVGLGPRRVRGRLRRSLTPWPDPRSSPGVPIGSIRCERRFCGVVAIHVCHCRPRER